MIQSHLFKCVAKQVWSQGIVMRATTKNCCSYDASRASRHSESVSDFGSPSPRAGWRYFRKRGWSYQQGDAKPFDQQEKDDKSAAYQPAKVGDDGTARPALSRAPQ